jgi:hypothetical protein
LLCGIPVVGLAVWLKSSWLPGKTVIGLILAACLIISIGLLLAFIFCVEPEHRLMVRDTLLKKLKRARTPLDQPASELSNAGPIG